MQPDRDITALLPRLLADIKRPGDFYGTGEVPLPVVRLAVDGVGILGLPLPPMQVEALARVATPAPYGRGGDTLVDPKVRRCGQIGASAVDASDGRWQALLDTVVGRAAGALGVEGGPRPACTRCWSTRGATSFASIATPRRYLGCSRPW